MKGKINVRCRTPHHLSYVEIKNGQMNGIFMLRLFLQIQNIV